jgi:peptide/nickel transport system permease protein
MFVVGASLAILLCSVALFGRALAPNDPIATDVLHILAPPSDAYPLGTDELGRCIASRLLAGAGATLGSALLVEAVILVLGVAVGTLAGWCGGGVDTVCVTVIDTLLAFPSIILAIVIAGTLGAGLHNLILAMCAVYWVEHARIARSLTRGLRERGYIAAAYLSGGGAVKIIVRHILPHLLPQMLIRSTLNVSSILIGISSLSFLGLGVRPPRPEWGASLSEARAYINTNPRALILPIVCILVATAAFQLLGEALRDAMNPRKSHLVAAREGGRVHARRK